MLRNYEVFIEGRPLTIGPAPDPRSVPPNWLSVHIHAAEEIVPLIDRTLRGQLFAGVHLHGDVERIWTWFRAAHRFVQAAGGAVTDESGRLLAIHRLGVWDLPKGKVEKGEAIDAAAVREVQEECGLEQVHIVRPLPATWHTYERKGEQHLKRTDWFLMRASSMEPLTAQTEEDIDAVRWLDAAGVAELERSTYPSLLPVVKAWKDARDRV
jgi:ADP-ribose pyrophosphatase YjhB (NUDIX family)